jgi:fructoselysine-6-P-deglycase FrlB-like protein
MGKPFESELLQLAATYRWSLSLDTTPLVERVHALASSPLLVIGSGGSQSTAHLIADLHQRRFGELSKADTPLVASSSLRGLKSCGILLVSAGGKNRDILGVARAAVEAEPKSLIALCASKGSPLRRVVEGFSRGFCFEFELPSGQDGFLATNSLLALSTVALTAYDYTRNLVPDGFEEIFGRSELRRSLGLSATNRSLFDCKYLVVLYGPESRSAALDLESKLIEAGLVSVQLSDYRNFGHGRHHWLAKNPDTAVVALASSDERRLAERTVALLPRKTQAILIKTELSGITSWLALQAAVFALVAEYGASRKIDPGRPGVPEFGRRIHHLNAFRQKKEGIRAAAIGRKLRASRGANTVSPQKLEKGYRKVCERFRKARFHGIVMDYDGTICDHVDRFGAIPAEGAEALARIIGAGFLLGIATGRGRSVREALQKGLPRQHWERVWVGYYNGGAIARLDDAEQPDTKAASSPELRYAAEALGKLRDSGFELSVRPQQITVETTLPMDVADLWSRVVQCLQESEAEGLKVVVSTRSVDVVPVTTTKLTLLKVLNEVRPDSTLVCVGDRPRWPGNDFELLGHEFSLSVDEVDGDPETAWNLAPAGVLGASALRYYLRRIKFRSKYFKIELGEE